jgi:hypothetical protein
MKWLWMILWWCAGMIFALVLLWYVFYISLTTKEDSRALILTPDSNGDNTTKERTGH